VATSVVAVVAAVVAGGLQRPRRLVATEVVAPAAVCPPS